MRDFDLISTEGAATNNAEALVIETMPFSLAIERSQNAKVFVGQQLPFHALSRAELRAARNRPKA